MNLKINRDISGEIESPALLAGWPGMGNVGVGAVDYIRRKIDAVPFAEVDMKEYFTPEAVEVENGIAKFPDLPSHVFYYVPSSNLIIFESETQVAGGGGVSLMNQILDLAQQLGVRTVYTGAAFAMPISHKQEVQVLGVANQSSLRDTLEPHGVEILQQGHISGLNGLLLGFAGLRDIEAACLLATMPQYAIQMPNPKASRAIVQVFESLLDIEVDMSEIDEAAEQVNRSMGEIEGKIQSGFSSMAKEAKEEGEEEELDQLDEEKVPQYVMERIERLFHEVQSEGSKEKAAQLKKELDRWELYSLYEDRFLNLFR
ncbi:MAG: PAC2 family protein [Candidatus Latescibacteria bacterium]|jgi:hypothetical protein|nr:PAC2 family protein [Candidatus Latescibacterota bacterium]